MIIAMQQDVGDEEEASTTVEELGKDKEHGGDNDPPHIEKAVQVIRTSATDGPHLSVPKALVAK